MVFEVADSPLAYLLNIFIGIPFLGLIIAIIKLFLFLRDLQNKSMGAAIVEGLQTFGTIFVADVTLDFGKIASLAVWVLQTYVDYCGGVLTITGTVLTNFFNIIKPGLQSLSGTHPLHEIPIELIK